MTQALRHILCVLLILGGIFPLIHSGLLAQPSSENRDGPWEVMIDPMAVMTLPTGELSSIRGSVPCSPTFAPAININPGIGVRWLLIVNNESHARAGFSLRGFALAAGYDNLSSTWQSNPAGDFHAFDPTSDSYVAVATEHTAKFRFSTIRIASDAEFVAAPELFVRFGPTVNIGIDGDVVEQEIILEPSNATFLDRTQERTIAEGTGTVTDVGIRIGAAASVAYRLPLGRSIFFEPTVGIDIGFGSMQPAWRPLLVRGGISIGYHFSSPTKPPVADVPIVPPPPLVPERPFKADIGITVSAERLPLEFRRQIVARYVPLLPVVFFEQNIGELPSRYKSAITTTIQESDLTADANQIQSRSLDIFGARLAASPRTNVVITGATSNDEIDRLALATVRSQAVATYLTERWGIKPSRITLRSRLDPLRPSNPAYAEGREENRRVDMAFSDPAIYRSITLRSVEPITEPAAIKWRTHAVSELGIAAWHVDIRDGQRIIETLSGRGAPPEIITWNLDNNDREQLLTSRMPDYQLTVVDSIGRSVASAVTALPVRLDTTVSVTTQAERPDNSADFLLVTFEFDRAELSPLGRQELKTILSRIGPTSSVTVIGYTDPIGEAEHNLKLAEERARIVASQMPSTTHVEYRGATAEEAPYSSQNPTGRFLSRTVRVIITNPAP